MRLYLVQHGIPRPKEEDPERSLSPEGRTEAKRMAEYISSKGVSVRTIYHSPKLRARQTAEVFAEALRPERVEEDNALNPLDEPSVWAERLHNTEEDVMLVGHLPHLQRLASALLINDPERPLIGFRQAGVVCLEKTEEGWLIKWSIVPELL